MTRLTRYGYSPLAALVLVAVSSGLGCGGPVSIDGPGSYVILDISVVDPSAAPVTAAEVYVHTFQDPNCTGTNAGTYPRQTTNLDGETRFNVGFPLGEGPVEGCVVVGAVPPIGSPLQPDSVVAAVTFRSPPAYDSLSIELVLEP